MTVPAMTVPGGTVPIPAPTPSEPAGVPALRLLPAPVCQPPYDDEPPAATALRLVRPPRRLPVAPVRPPLRVVPGAADDSELDVEAWLSARRTPTCELPPAGPFARALVQRLLEALAGVRPIRQLRGDTTPELYAVLERAAARRALTPGPALRPDGRAVRSVHTQARPEGVVEVCATVVRAGRAGALALRLEGLDGRWQCTELIGV